jgi:hypothetical protein
MNLQTYLKYKYHNYIVRKSRHAFEYIKQKQSYGKFRIGGFYDRRKRSNSSYSSLAHKWLGEEYAIIKF